jgi:hypothetical protein
MNDAGSGSFARKRLCAVAFSVFAVLATVFVITPSSSAATRIVQPGDNPYHVVLDAQGKPQPFTVSATGFQPGHLVYLEQCNGRGPAEPNWSPSLDCDVGNAPPPAIVDKSGTATFATTDPDRKFTPFVGPSPSSLFNCLAPNGPHPNNGLTSYTNCQIRVSSNNVAATQDQVFSSIVFGGSGGGSSHAGWLIALGAVLVVLAILGLFLVLRGRSSADAEPKSAGSR